MCLKRAAIAGAVVMLFCCGGCVNDDEAKSEPTAKTQKVLPDKGTDADAANSKDQKDEKSVEQDEKVSKS